jgi:hypothetical protein
VSNNLAELYRQQGRFDEAEPLQLRALGIVEKALGPDHPYLGMSLNNLAELYREQGRLDEAEPQPRAGNREKALGPDHPTVISVPPCEAVCGSRAICGGGHCTCARCESPASGRITRTWHSL